VFDAGFLGKVSLDQGLAQLSEGKKAPIENPAPAAA
jgi:hypothetical protein